MNITADDLKQTAIEILNMADALRDSRASITDITNEEFTRSFNREMVLRNQHVEILIAIINIDSKSFVKVINTINDATKSMANATKKIKGYKGDITIVAKTILFLAALIAGDVGAILTTGTSLISS